MSMQDEWQAMIQAKADQAAAEREPTPAERTVQINKAGGELLERLFEAADQESTKPATTTDETPDGYSSDVARALGITN